MKEYQEQFQKYWDGFISRLTAEIKRRGNKQLPSLTVMNMILTDAALDWDSDETICGRWLREVTDKKPCMGRAARAVLVDDMKFRSAEHQKSILKYILLLLPVLGALAGFGISWLFGAGIWLKILCTAAAGLLLIPVLMLLEKQAQEQEKNRHIQAYLDQLGMYYQSIISILGE